MTVSVHFTNGILHTIGHDAGCYPTTRPSNQGIDGVWADTLEKYILFSESNCSGVAYGPYQGNKDFNPAIVADGIRILPE